MKKTFFQPESGSFLLNTLSFCFKKKIFLRHFSFSGLHVLVAEFPGDVIYSLTDSAFIYLNCAFSFFTLMLLLLLYLKILKKKTRRTAKHAARRIRREDTGLRQNQLQARLRNEIFNQSGFTANFTGSCKLDDAGWERLTATVDSAFGYFISRLKVSCPKLNEKEIRLCCLLKMGLDTSSIARCMHISKECVRVCKCRLRKKLQLCEKGLDLDEFLSLF